MGKGISNFFGMGIMGQRPVCQRGAFLHGGNSPFLIYVEYITDTVKSNATGLSSR